MTDRELLELAAKAAGHKHTQWSPMRHPLVGWGICTLDGLWNPLISDGDALRLAVKLKLTPYFYKEHNTTYVATDDVADPEGFDCVVHWDDDPYAATRRAIVRAAAAIGEGL